MAPKKTTTPMTDAAIKGLIAQGIADALAKYEANRSSRNGDDKHESEVAEGEIVLLLVSALDIVTSDMPNPLTLSRLKDALTWRNSHVKIVGHDAAYGMTWKTLMKMMTAKYCPRSEIRKLEFEIWNLKVKGTDVVSYT
ncbi:hypothetical protein Tco_0934928 [Tanacetum coccineum]